MVRRSPAPRRSGAPSGRARPTKRPLPLASFPAAAKAKETGGGHPDEVRRYSLNPRLKPGIDEGRALGLGIEVMRRSAHQHEPPRARLRIDLVGLHGHLVLGVRDTGTQVF